MATHIVPEPFLCCWILNLSVEYKSHLLFWQFFKERFNCWIACTFGEVLRATVVPPLEPGGGCRIQHEGRRGLQ